MIRILRISVCHHVMPSTSTYLPLVLHVCVTIVSGNSLLPVWHQAISIMYFMIFLANKDMFELNLKYPVVLLICLLWCIKFELN